MSLDQRAARGTQIRLHAEIMIEASRCQHVPCAIEGVIQTRRTSIGESASMKRGIPIEYLRQIRRAIVECDRFLRQDDRVVQQSNNNGF